MTDNQQTTPNTSKVSQIVDELRNMSPELRKRLMVAVPGGLVLLLIVLFGGWIGIAFLTAIISLGMMNEFCNLNLLLQDKEEKRYALLCLTWLVSLVNLIVPRAEFEILVISFLALFSYFLFTVARHQGETFTAHFKELMYSLFGVFYLVFLPLYLPLIHGASHGVNWTILFFLIVWAGDTAAYFVGRKYGKIKLYPIISPNKTREGAYGGLGAGVVIALIAKLTFFRQMPWLAILFVPAFVGAASQLGDLCESFLKRAYNVKDSGSMLPGHGGFLDRFDGLIFALPIMYLCTRIF